MGDFLAHLVLLCSAETRDWRLEQSFSKRNTLDSSFVFKITELKLLKFLGLLSLQKNGLILETYLTMRLILSNRNLTSFMVLTIYID